MPDSTIMDDTDGDLLARPAPEWRDPDREDQAAQRASVVLDLEAAVVGAALVSKEHAEALIATLDTVHFTDQRHREIWAALVDVVGRGEPVGHESVRREITRRRGLADAQIDMYVLERYNTAPVGAAVDYYVQQIREDYKRRRADAVRARVGQLTHPSRDWHADQLEGVDHLGHIIGEFQKVQLDDDEAAMSVAGDGSEVSAIIEGWGIQPEGSFDFGLAEVDAALNVVPGSLVVVGAYTGVGKSTLASQAARRSIAKGLPAAQFTGEMSVTQLRQRDLCALARVHLSTTTGNRELTSADRELLREWAMTYERDSTEVGYYLEYVPAMTVNHIRARLSWIKRTHGQVGVVVVDYLQLMKLESGEDNNARTAATTAALKQLAGEMECVIVLLSQCRKPDDKGVPRPPTRWDLIGAGAIANDADAVILIHDPCPKSVPVDELSPAAVARRGEVDLIIAKNRSGPEQTSVLSDMRHLAHFASCDDDEDTDQDQRSSSTVTPFDRGGMTPEERASGGFPALS